MIASSPEKTSSLVGSLPTEKHRGNTGTLGLTRVVSRARVHVGLDMNHEQLEQEGCTSFVVLSSIASQSTGGAYGIDRDGVQSVIQDDPYVLCTFRYFEYSMTRLVPA